MSLEESSYLLRRTIRKAADSSSSSSSSDKKKKKKKEKKKEKKKKKKAPAKPIFQVLGIDTAMSKVNYCPGKGEKEEGEKRQVRQGGEGSAQLNSGVPSSLRHRFSHKLSLSFSSVLRLLH